VAISRELQAILEKIKSAANLTDAELRALKKAFASSGSDGVQTPTGDISRAQSDQYIKDLEVEKRIRQVNLEMEMELVAIRDTNRSRASIERQAAEKAAREEEDHLKKKIEILENVTGLSEEEEKKHQKLLKTLKKELDAQKKKNAALERQNELLGEAESMGEGMGKTFAGLFGLSTDGLGGLMAKAGEAGGSMKMLGSIGQGVGAQLAAAFNPYVIVGALLAKVVETFHAVDQLNEELYTDTGIENLGHKVSTFSQDIKLLDNASEEMTATLKSMQTEFQGFYDLSEETQVSLAQTSAIMVKMGIDAQATAQSTGFLITSLGMTAEEADRTNREMVTLAHSLSLPPAQVMESFNAASKSLSKYGDGMTIEFKRMQAASKTLNMDVGNLIETMAGMDTFEGAANMAGDLNAMLGGPYLNSIELLGQTESERLVTLSRTLKAQGLTFKQMSKFQKAGIAKTLGMDIDELGKLMAKGPEELESAMAKADKEAKSREEMAKNVENMMGVFATFMMEVRAIFKEVFKDIFGEGESLVFMKESLIALLKPIAMVVKIMATLDGYMRDFFKLLGFDGPPQMVIMVKTLGILTVALKSVKFIVDKIVAGFKFMAQAAGIATKATEKLTTQGTQTSSSSVASKAAEAGKAAAGKINIGGKNFSAKQIQAGFAGKGAKEALAAAGGDITKMSTTKAGTGLFSKIGGMLSGGKDFVGKHLGNMLGKIPGGELIKRMFGNMGKIPIVASLLEGIFAFGDIKSIMSDPSNTPEDMYGPIGERFFEAIGGVGGGAAAAALVTALTGGAGILASTAAYMGGDILGRMLSRALEPVLPTKMVGKAIYSAAGPGSSPAPTPVNDFVVYRPSSSDEMVGLKEGGILAKKLDKIADLLVALEKKTGSTVIELDGRKVGQSVVRTINNDLYSIT